ncbi:MAG TPA: glycosyltransferase family 2 protein [Chthonomonadaceae bacterium]|nr:glycosyltransferase family 2 protein [Chthonomonadaceae bacterium]
MDKSCPDLSVVILNWNTCKLLEKCLRSLELPQPGLKYEVVVVDNASEDNSREMVKRLFPRVRLLVNKCNVGFGEGNNAALPHTTGRYVLFLNSDTEVTEGALAAMVRFADSQPDIGILGPKLLNGDGSLQYSCRRYPNLGTGFFRNTPLGRLFPHNRFTTDYLYQDWDHNTPRDVDWVSGAALMIRRTLLDQIGGFDTTFFMYCEDVDLCWRANHAPLEEEGCPTWRVTYFPDAIIYHLIGKSTDIVPTRMTYEFHRSQYIFYKKHYAASTPLLLRPLIPVGIGLRAVGQMARYRINYWRRRLRGPQQPKTRQGGKA